MGDHKSYNLSTSSLYKEIITIIVIIAFLSLQIIPIFPNNAYAQSALNLPPVGTMIAPTSDFVPVVMRGIKIFPDNPLKFDFIMDTGNTDLEDEKFEEESSKLIKYFLASLTIPEDELWVNLSPYEKDRIIPDKLGVTEMGRDLLAQDYVLKQLTASLLYPEDELGEKFWDRVYSKANELYGMTEIPVNTFNKVWVVPESATVYENGDVAFVTESHLKVMLEEDYDALQQDKHETNDETMPVGSHGHKMDVADTSYIASNVIRDIIIPEIEKEVNTGEHFVLLRQIYNSMILATWFKRNLKESLLGQVYIEKNKVSGVDVEDKKVSKKIYDQYLEAFKVGVYDYIREDYDPNKKAMVPRKHFSGGFGFDRAMADAVNIKSVESPEELSDAAQAAVVGYLKTVEAFLKNMIASISGSSKSIVRNADYEEAELVEGADVIISTSVRFNGITPDAQEDVDKQVSKGSGVNPKALAFAFYCNEAIEELLQDLHSKTHLSETNVGKEQFVRGVMQSRLESFVENAIDSIDDRYGSDFTKGEIKLSARFEDKKLWVEVLDNGTGFIQEGKDLSSLGKENISSYKKGKKTKSEFDYIGKRGADTAHTMETVVNLGLDIVLRNRTNESGVIAAIGFPISEYSYLSHDFAMQGKESEKVESNDGIQLEDRKSELDSSESAAGDATISALDAKFGEEFEAQEKNDHYKEARNLLINVIKEILTNMGIEDATNEAVNIAEKVDLRLLENAAGSSMNFTKENQIKTILWDVEKDGLRGLIAEIGHAIQYHYLPRHVHAGIAEVYDIFSQWSSESEDVVSAFKKGSFFQDAQSFIGTTLIGFIESAENSWTWDNVPHYADLNSFHAQVLAHLGRGSPNEKWKKFLREFYLFAHAEWPNHPVLNDWTSDDMYESEVKEYLRASVVDADYNFNHLVAGSILQNIVQEAGNSLSVAGQVIYEMLVVEDMYFENPRLFLEKALELARKKGVADVRVTDGTISRFSDYRKVAGRFVALEGFIVNLDFEGTRWVYSRPEGAAMLDKILEEAGKGYGISVHKINGREETFTSDYKKSDLAMTGDAEAGFDESQILKKLISISLKTDDPNSAEVENGVYEFSKKKNDFTPAETIIRSILKLYQNFHDGKIDESISRAYFLKKMVMSLQVYEFDSEIDNFLREAIRRKIGVEKDQLVLFHGYQSYSAIVEGGGIRAYKASTAGYRGGVGYYTTSHPHSALNYAGMMFGINTIMNEEELRARNDPAVVVLTLDGYKEEDIPLVYYNRLGQQASEMSYNAGESRSAEQILEDLITAQIGDAPMYMLANDGGGTKLDGGGSEIVIRDPNLVREGQMTIVSPKDILTEDVFETLEVPVPNALPESAELLIQEESFTGMSDKGASAMVGGTDKQKVGGIDLNPDMLEINKEGSGIDFDVPFDAQSLESIQIDGFSPVILQIVPTNLPLLLGIAEDEEESEHELQLSSI